MLFLAIGPLGHLLLPECDAKDTNSQNLLLDGANERVTHVQEVVSLCLKGLFNAGLRLNHRQAPNHGHFSQCPLGWCVLHCRSRTFIISELEMNAIGSSLPL